MRAPVARVEALIALWGVKLLVKTSFIPAILKIVFFLKNKNNIKLSVLPIPPVYQAWLVDIP